MGKPVIELQSLSKRFRINHQREGYLTLRDRLANPVRAMRLLRQPVEDFWALRDVSFNVESGETIGVIGKNGSGKSTLLKILSQITPPTKGQVVMRGRAASLLEVGTGFHPELTGRENIFLSGVILGMKKTDIYRAFDEIVDFAGVEKFLDTPVKRYSSGMSVRLGFAVAAHLQSEILIVDEVLAVGDAEFQSKCMGKMDELAKRGGRTILFVSHNMDAVARICNRSALLQGGQLRLYDDTAKVIARYLSDDSDWDGNFSSVHGRIGSGKVQVESFQLRDKDDNRVSCLYSGQAGKLCFKCKAKDQNIDNYDFYLAIDTADGGYRLATLSNYFVDKKLSGNDTEVIFTLNKLALNAGIYRFTFYLENNGEILDWIQSAGSFEVAKGDFYQSGRSPVGKDQGLVLLDYKIN